MIDTTKQNFIIYSTDESNVNIQILADSKNETIWLNQKQIAQIFDVNVPAISKHISNILSDNELDDSTISILENVRKDGTCIGVKHYNLDMIIAVGYRVNSKKATKFRIWATKTLKEFIIKGFILDDERLKQGNNVFNKDYIDELIERIREIRASERLFYDKIKDVFALSIDYDKTSNKAKEFSIWQSDKDKIEYIHKRIDYLCKKIGIYTVFITAFFFNTLKYFLPYLEKLFIYTANKLSNVVENFFDIGSIYGIGDFLVTFLLFPFFTLSYTIVTMFWVYFIVKDYHQIRELNSKLKLYDKKYNLKIIDSENNDFIQKFSIKILKYYEECFESNSGNKCKILFTMLISLSYIGYVVYKF